MRGGLALLLVLSAVAAMAGDGERLDLFKGDLEAWEEHRFEGSTGYRLLPGPGGTVLHARAQGTASGVFRDQRIDLHRTPWLNWSWKVDRFPGLADERSREGDDFAARLYVVKTVPLMFWRTRALTYVWSRAQSRGESWPNPFTGNARMLALRNADDGTGQWRRERRNVRADLRRLFGEDIRYIDAVAIMSDADNSGGEAEASYGSVWFSAR